MLKCTLCFMPFKVGDLVYEMQQDDGKGLNSFHQSCFYSTRQGSMGYSPAREYRYGESQQFTLDFFGLRFNKVE